MNLDKLKEAEVVGGGGIVLITPMIPMEAGASNPRRKIEEARKRRKI